MAIPGWRHKSPDKPRPESATIGWPEVLRGRGTSMARRSCGPFRKVRVHIHTLNFPDKPHCRPSAGIRTIGYGKTYVLVVRVGVVPSIHGFSAKPRLRTNTRVFPKILSILTVLPRHSSPL